MKDEKKQNLKKKALERAATKLLKQDDKFQKLKELGNKKADIYKKRDRDVN